MSSHFLARTYNNDPVCSCGYRPAILDDFRPWSEKQIKAKTDVLDHAKAMNDAESANEWEAALDRLAQPAATPAPRRSPDDPFIVPDAHYPRAGVRRTEDGRWKLSCWDGDQIVHVIDEPIFDDRVTAFDYGWLTIGACRQAGTNLNGWEAA